MRLQAAGKARSAGGIPPEALLRPPVLAMTRSCIAQRPQFSPCWRRAAAARTRRRTPWNVDRLGRTAQTERTPLRPQEVRHPGRENGCLKARTESAHRENQGDAQGSQGSGGGLLAQGL